MTHSHTPLPWAVSGIRTRCEIPSVLNIYSENENIKGWHIAVPYSDITDDEHIQSQADAEFIVRACNNHYQLVEALEWILKIADVNYEQDGKLRHQGARTLKRIAEKAEAALAAAKGEQS